jgi:hypothetical protein
MNFVFLLLSGALFISSYKTITGGLNIGAFASFGINSFSTYLRKLGLNVPHFLTPKVIGILLIALVYISLKLAKFSKIQIGDVNSISDFNYIFGMNSFLIILCCFLIGNNFDYRLIFAVPLIQLISSGDIKDKSKLSILLIICLTSIFWCNLIYYKSSVLGNFALLVLLVFLSANLFPSLIKYALSSFKSLFD